MTPLATIDCTQKFSVLWELLLSVFHTIKTQATALFVILGSTCAVPEWACGSHRTHSHPGPSWVIKVSSFYPIAMTDRVSSSLISQSHQVSHPGDLCTHKIAIIKGTWWPFLGLEVTRFSHNIPFHPPRWMGFHGRSWSDMGILVPLFW